MSMEAAPQIEIHTHHSGVATRGQPEPSRFGCGPFEGQKGQAMQKLPNPQLNQLTEDFDGIEPRDVPIFCPKCGSSMEIPDCTSCGHLIELCV